MTILFSGAALYHPSAAAEVLAAQEYDIAALQDLAPIFEDTPAYEALQEAIRAGDAGDMEQVRSIVREKIAPLVAKYSPEAWRQKIDSIRKKHSSPTPSDVVPLERGSGLASPSDRGAGVGLAQPPRISLWFARLKRRFASPQEALRQARQDLAPKDTLFEKKLIEWERLRQTHEEMPFSRFKDEICTELAKKYIALLNQVSSSEELNQVLSLDVGSLFFALFVRSDLFIYPPLRRAILNYWRPGTILPWRFSMLHIDDLFQAKNWGAFDEEDEKWRASNITDRRHEEWLEILSEGMRPLYDRVMAVMQIIEEYPLLSNLPDYLERRAKEKKLDIADLMFVASYIYQFRFHLYDLSRDALENLVETAIQLTPMTNEYSFVQRIPFSEFYSERFLRGLPDDLQLKLIIGLAKKAISLKMPDLDWLISKTILEELTSAEKEELLSLYERDPDVALAHTERYLILLTSLPPSKRKPHETFLLGLLKANQMENFYQSIHSILEYFEKKWKKERLPEKAARERLKDLAKISHQAVFMAKGRNTNFNTLQSIWMCIREIAFDWAKEFGNDLLLPFAPVAGSWLDMRFGFNWYGLVTYLERLAPFQPREWATLVIEKIFHVYSTRQDTSFLPTDFSKLLSYLTADEKALALTILMKTQMENPLSRNASFIEKVIQTNFSNTEVAGGFVKMLGELAFRLDPDVILRLKEFASHPKYPLSLEQISLIIHHLGKTQIEENESERAFFDAITKNTPADGMVYEWLLLLRDLREIKEEDREGFIKEQIARYEALQNKSHFSPPRIRKTLKSWLRERFFHRLGFVPEETRKFKTNSAKHQTIWHQNGFLDLLVAMSSFVTPKGLSAIKTLVLNIINNPSQGENSVFDFRYIGMRKIFGDEFVTRWSRERRYTVMDDKSETPEEAKKRFLQQVGESLESHLPEKLPPDLKKFETELRSLVTRLKEGNLPEMEKVDGFILALRSLHDAQNDLVELRRGEKRSFRPGQQDRVRISGDPRDIIRAGLIGRVSCTRPNDPYAQGNQNAESVGRCLHGPILIAIYERDGVDSHGQARGTLKSRVSGGNLPSEQREREGEAPTPRSGVEGATRAPIIESARSIIEVTKDENGVLHYTAEPLYAEGGFVKTQAFADILVTDAAFLEINSANVHIQFANLNMDDDLIPPLLSAAFRVYNDSFKRSNAPANHSFAP